LILGVTLPNFFFLKVPWIPWGIVLMTALQIEFYPKLVERKTMSFSKIEVAKRTRSGMGRAL